MSSVAEATETPAAGLSMLATETESPTLLTAVINKFGFKENEITFIRKHFSYMPTKAELYTLLQNVTKLEESRANEIILKQRVVVGRISLEELKRECVGFIIRSKSSIPRLPTSLETNLRRGVYSYAWEHWERWGSKHNDGAVRSHFEKYKIPTTGPTLNTCITWVTKELGDNFIKWYASNKKCRETVKQHVNGLNFLINLERRILSWALGSGEASVFQEGLLDRHGKKTV